ncbi:hypothetical protein [Pseudoalteromonas phenolica]|uniref:hypothetical protein n=1 Tax=Pseudoalteromonas phenolica TaxID=161398 RepID=UPI00110B849A|nr:hypothetical protein [Pseudoalteromonas phenolica]TMO53835.1 hypothetical protein CWC21_17280 [Pseudoalteromonas phenolica]
MNLVPVEGGGHVPMSTSKNPVLGVYRHHCGEIATVHQPKGQKKAHLRYLLCPKCKCDQASGDEYQQLIRENTYRTIEELEAAEAVKLTVNQNEQNQLAETPDTPADAVYKDVDRPESALLNQPLQVVESELTEQPSETPTDVVKPLPEQPTVKPIAQPNTPAANDSDKTKKVAVCAVLGAIVGGLFAIAR